MGQNQSQFIDVDSESGRAGQRHKETVVMATCQWLVSNNVISDNGAV